MIFKLFRAVWILGLCQIHPEASAHTEFQDIASVAARDTVWYVRVADSITDLIFGVRISQRYVFCVKSPYWTLDLLFFRFDFKAC